MKNYTLRYIILALITITAFTASRAQAQTDTLKTRKQYQDLQKDIADIKLKIEDSKSKISLYQTKALQATEKAQEAALKSNDASGNTKAGDAKASKKAAKAADKANDKAGDASDATKKWNNEKERLEDLNKELTQKQNKLQSIQSGLPVPAAGVQ
jgi:chromosome segregation ATPase